MTTPLSAVWWLPILCDVSCGPPGEGVVVPAVGHDDADGADSHADSIRLVVNWDGAEVCVQFVFVHLLGANQLTVHRHTLKTGERLKEEGRSGHTSCGQAAYQVRNVSN